MSRFLSVLRYGARALVALQLILGIAFWMGALYALLPVHMLLGLLLVIDAWIVAVFALRAGTRKPMAILTLVWGLVVIALGVTQTGIMPGGAHWVIRVVHLLIGLALVGFIEQLARGIMAARAQTPAGASGKTGSPSGGR